MLGPIQHLKVMSATIFYTNLPLETEVKFWEWSTFGQFNPFWVNSVQFKQILVHK